MIQAACGQMLLRTAWSRYFRQRRSSEQQAAISMIRFGGMKTMVLWPHKMNNWRYICEVGHRDYKSFLQSIFMATALNFKVRLANKRTDNFGQSKLIT
jgi:hypothetical protein